MARKPNSAAAAAPVEDNLPDQEESEFDFSSLIDDEGTDTENTEGEGAEQTPPESESESEGEGKGAPASPDVSEQTPPAEAKPGVGAPASEPATPAANVQSQPERPAEAQPAQTPPAQQVQEAQPQPQQQISEQDRNAQVQAWFNNGVDRLSKEVYALSPEDAQRLDESPSEVLPQLAARLHMQVLVAATAQAANMIPMMVPQIVEQQRSYKAKEDSFYDKYPQLKGHNQVVDRVAQAYVSLPRENRGNDPMADVAAMAATLLRIPLTQSASPAPAQAAAMAPPVKPMAATPATAAAPAAQQQKSVWEELISDEGY